MRNAVTLMMAALALLLVSPDDAAAQDQLRLADGTVLLPHELDATPLNAARQRALSQRPAWQDFTAQHGRWLVQWNEATGTPQRAIGSARIPGFNNVTGTNVTAAAEAFLRAHADVLRAEMEDLELTKSVAAGDRTYLGFRQLHQGLPVLFSEVELAIFENGRVPMIGSVIYSGIEVDTAPALSAAAAQTAATAGLAFDAATDRTAADGQLYVVPVRDGSDVRYHLAYEVLVETAEPLGQWWTLVDAHSGAVLMRQNLVVNHNHSLPAPYAVADAPALVEAAVAEQAAAALASHAGEDDITGTVTGGVYEVNPFISSEEQEPFPDFYVTVGGERVTTDELGEFMRSGVSGPQDVTATMRGEWHVVDRRNGADASFTGTATPGEPFTLEWDDSNSAANERNGYASSMRVRDYLERLYEDYAEEDQEFTYMDYQMPVNVGLTSNACNAFWDGNSISFYRAGGGCPDIALLASVVYHEYGHGVNQRLYRELSSFFMRNRAANEATADVLAIMLEDSPDLGRGFRGAGTLLRDADNTFVYPDDYDPSDEGPDGDLGAAYNNSRILSGAFWELRERAGLETARRLAHFSKYSTPDDANTAVAFSEWFVAVLTADDDDGDLSNGTPNYDAIVGAFDQHGIGLSLLLVASAEHDPLTDTRDGGPYEVEVEVDDLAVGPEGLVEVVYSTDDFQTSATLTATADGGDYVAEIPRQGPGTIVRYYIRIDSGSGAEVFLPEGAPEAYYTFLIAFDTLESNAFEEETGWTAEADPYDPDVEMQGAWERADPEEVSTSAANVYQPEDDHTEDGTMAFVTGAIGGSPFLSGVKRGATTLTSETYNVEGVQNPTFSFWVWFRSLPVGSYPLVIELSDDGGDSWTTALELARDTNEWERFVLAVEDYVSATDEVQVRFVVEGPAGGFSIVDALVDDFLLLEAGDSVANEGTATATATALDAVFPNPAGHSAATVAFTLANAGDVSLEVFDLLGRRVAVAAEGAFPAGRHEAAFETANLPGGTYLVRLQAGDRVETEKVTVLR